MQRSSLVHIVAWYVLTVGGLLLAGALPAESGWQQQARLMESDGSSDDWLGAAVAIDGDTLLVGVRGDDTSCLDCGAALVYVRSNGVWSLQAHLFGDPAPGAYFGWSVALDGNRAVVGAHWEDTDGYESAGAAYVFLRSGSVWTRELKIKGSGEYDNVGSAVALENDTLVVGAEYDQGSGGARPGRAYVYIHNGSNWVEQGVLSPSDGDEWDLFGCSAAISADTVVIGAYQDDDHATDSGAAYVFVRSDGEWSQQGKLSVSGSEQSDRLGLTVDVEGNTAVVGSFAREAYVFTRSDGVWSLQDTLEELATTGSCFGRAVSLDAGAVLVGSCGGTNYKSAAVLYTQAGGAWSVQEELVVDNANSDSPGHAVARDGATIAIGAMDEIDELFQDVGAVFVLWDTGAQIFADGFESGDASFWSTSTD